jgi:hypothetical protein
LQAGTYFTWATGVMPGLARVDDRTFVEAMQRVNVAIVNPVFVSTFLGGSAPRRRRCRHRRRAGAPMGDRGDRPRCGDRGDHRRRQHPAQQRARRSGTGRSGQRPGAVRAAFEPRWVRLNVLRSLTSAGALACLSWAASR